MNILKNILGAFVEFPNDNTAKEAATTPAATPPPPPPKPAVNPVVTPSPSAASTTATAPAYRKHFDDLLEEANANNPLFSGTDFKEFVDSKAELDAIGDEPTKYRTAFNVLKRTGLTKERLLSTGQEYINVIQRDLDAFEKAYAQQYKADVENKESLLQQKAKELQALTDKIASLNKEMKDLDTQMAQSKDRLGANRASFVQAGEAKKRDIKDELDKIEQYF